MPARTPTKSPAQSPAIPVTEQPKPAAKDATGTSKLARRVYEQVKGRLEGELDNFLEDATLEESRFMIEVLSQRSSNTYGAPRALGEYDIPIYSAIQDQMDCGGACVVVPNIDMVPKVEEFIATMEKKRWKKPRYDGAPSEEEIIQRWKRGFRSEIDLFAINAGLPSLRLMHAILARWNELFRDPEVKILPNCLAIAAKIELDKLGAETAAEAAGKENK